MKNHKSIQGTWVEKELFESKAFLSLKGVAPQVLIIMLGKRIITKHGKKGKERKTTINKDEIYFTYIEAEKLGITQPRCTRAIDDLMAKGFIRIIHAGGAFKKDKTRYGLLDDWQFWKPGTVYETRPKEAVKRGFRKSKKK